MRHSNRPLLLSCLATLLFAGSAAASPTPSGDYGDAPDGFPALYAPPFGTVKGKFPTSAPTTNSRYGLPGAHTLDAKDTYFGRLSGAELGPADCISDPDKTPNFIDDDFDDAVSGSLCPQAGGAGKVTLKLNVTMSSGSGGGVRYINVLVDADHGGTWNDTTGVEWVVRDFPVYPIPGTSTPVTVGPFVLPSSQVPMWTRIAITDKEVTAIVPVNATGWDGSGEFPIGEIEDYLLTNYSSQVTAIAASQDDADAYALALAGAASRAEAARAAADSDCADASAAAGEIATAYASALAAVATATINVQQAQQNAADADLACAGVAAGVGVWVAACASCQCAAACAAAGAAAAGAAAACGAAVASAQASASAAAIALTAAVAAAQAIGTSSGYAAAQAEACAASYAIAKSSAGALAVAAGEAEADAHATSLAVIDARIAACAGNVDAVLAASLSAQTHVAAAAAAMATAYTHAEAAAYAHADAAAIAGAAASASASAGAAVGVGVAVISLTVTAVEATAQAHASAAAIAAVVAAAGASAAAGCSSGCQQDYCCGETDTEAPETWESGSFNPLLTMGTFPALTKPVSCGGGGAP